jgi:hypothetical protein
MIDRNPLFSRVCVHGDSGNDPEFAGLGADVRTIIADVETIARSPRTRIENNTAKEPDAGTENKAA